MTCQCGKPNDWSIVNGYLKFHGQTTWKVLRSDCDGDPDKPGNVAYTARYRWIGDGKPEFKGLVGNRDPRWNEEIVPDL